MAPPHVLHVRMIDAVAEGADEFHVVDALIPEVRRVVVEAKTLVPFHRRDRALGAGDVERDLGGMHFEREVHVGLVEGLEDRAEPLREVRVSGVPVLLRRRRERVDRVPDARAGEAVDDGGKIIVRPAARLGVEKCPRGLRGERQLPGGPLAHPLGIAVAPDVGRQDRLVPSVDVVAHGLADEVTRDRVAGEAVVFEQRPLFMDVFLAARGGVDVEMIAPAGELDSIVAHLLDEGGQLFERKVGPLAGEQGDGAGHGGGFEGDWFRRGYCASQVERWVEAGERRIFCRRTWSERRGAHRTHGAHGRIGSVSVCSVCSVGNHL